MGYCKRCIKQTDDELYCSVCGGETDIYDKKMLESTQNVLVATPDLSESQSEINHNEPIDPYANQVSEKKYKALVIWSVVNLLLGGFPFGLVSLMILFSSRNKTSRKKAASFKNVQILNILGSFVVGAFIFVFILFIFFSYLSMTYKV